MTAVPSPHLASTTIDDRPLLRLRYDAGAGSARAERSTLRIGVNLLPLELRVGGMRHYVLQLLPELIRQSSHTFVLFYQPTGIPCLRKMLRTLTAEQKRRVTTIEVSYLEQVLAYGGLFDFYFCPLNGFAPQLLDRPTLATLADVQEQFFPQYFTTEQLEMRAEIYPNTARAVTTLLTLSEFSRQSISQAFDVPEEKVRPIHLAPNQGLLDAEPVWPNHREPLPERYLFYAASLYPHKNHEFLLRSFKQLIARNDDVSLVLTGHRTSPGIEIEDCIQELGLQDRVRWLGHVTSGELSFLYQHAQALVFPSLFEGFGMPLVEAMYFDCPVVAVSSTCVPEVVDDAGLLVPADEKQFCEAMERVLTDADLRRDLVERGRNVIGRYTVERLAETTLDLIDQTNERFWNPPGANDATISYVILPGVDDAAVEASLVALFDELGDQDEILVAGTLDDYGERLQAICHNCESVRIVGADDVAKVIAAARNDVVHVMTAGTIPCRGAAATAKAALANASDLIAVAGDVFSRDQVGNYCGITHLTNRGDCKRDTAMPIDAIFWKRKDLQRFAERLKSAKGLRRPRLPAGRVAPLYRTVTAVPHVGLSTISGEPQRLRDRIVRTLRRGPVGATRTGVRVARRVASRMLAKVG